MRSLQAICVEHLVRRLSVTDFEVDRLPETLALEVLRALLANAAANAAVAALRRWTLRRPAWHLHVNDVEGERILPRLIPSRFIEVSLSAVEITDSEVSRLLVHSGSSLKILHLQNCKLLNGRFLSDMETRPVLQRLLCDRCPGLLDDFVCRGLQELHLTHLSLAGAVRLTDAVASCLSGGAAPAPLPSVGVQLEYLDLSQTKVSDQGVSTLVRLPLSVLMLSRTARVTAQCLRQLSASLGLRALMPDRPRVLLRNFQTLSALSASVSMTTLDAKQLIPALQKGEVWPEEAVRHAVQLLHAMASDEVESQSRKRPGDTLHSQHWKKKNHQPAHFQKTSCVA